MSWLSNTSELVSGGWLSSRYAGHGATGAEIVANTATGDHGAGYLFNDVDSGDEAKEFRGLIVTPPSGGTFFADEDGSFSMVAPDGSYTFVYRLYVDGVDLGTATASVTIGSAGSVTGSSSVALGSISSAEAGSSAIAGASGVSLGQIAFVAAGDVVSAGSIVGSSSITLGSIGAAAAGASDVVGIAGVTLGAITSSSSAPIEDTATAPQYTLKGTARRLVMTMATISNPGFSDKDPWERLPLGFDFSRDLAEIGSTLAETPAPVITITHHSGTADASPAEVKDGAPWISGAIVKQWVDDGVVGARYLVRCEAYAANGARLVMSGTMMVRTK